MKKFFGEFKKFITRGNVIDMSVGVIVGSAFTAIVNGMSNFVLKPIINWILALIFGSNSLDGILTYLKKVEVTDATTGVTSIDLANSIYIDWGSLINAIINFLIIAFVLFTIVKVINKLKEDNEKLTASLMKNKLTKDQKKELKANGINLKDKDAVKAYFDEKAKKAEEALAEEKRIADEKAKADRLANPTTEDLLKQIKELLEKQVEVKGLKKETN
ncbi:MAG: large conductance mechanosensitive channel protein MscL [Clostridia bacterium]|nr:large conductance mechanosensitive channel protein MscL [Clostridia bacterium]